MTWVRAHTCTSGALDEGYVSGGWIHGARDEGMGLDTTRNVLYVRRGSKGSPNELISGLVVLKIMDDSVLVNQYSFHPPKSEEIRDKYNQIRNMGLEFARLVNEIVPPSREQSLAFTKIEEAVMWADKGISRNS